jgi:hypothetical protein
MADYMPLASNSPTEHDDEEFESLQTGIKLWHRSNGFSVANRNTLIWATILMAVTAILASAAFHISALSAFPGLERMRSPNDITSTLRMVQPYPNLEKGLATINKKKMKRPKMIFPRSFVRANAAEPNRVYNSGSSVLLSPSDSMFYHWKYNSTWPRCYISGWVSPHDKLVAANKSYIAEGDVTAIEIWNVSSLTDSESLTTMSWNTRPNRLSLMGTVNFTSRDIQSQIEHLDGQELRAPTPLFGCSGWVDLTVEIACKSCRLQFDQIFSAPALGFELIQLG